MLLIMRKSLFGTQEGREVAKKKPFVPPPRFMNVDEARYNCLCPAVTKYLF